MTISRNRVSAIAFAMIALTATAWCEPLTLLDFEGADSAFVHGGKVSTEQAASGTSSLKWGEDSKPKGLYFKNLPTDWSDYNQIAFSLYSAVANDADLVFIIRSENSETDGIDYYQMRMKVDWTGWKRFEWPLYTLGVSRKPIGWNKVDRMEIVADGWGNEAKPDTLLYLDNVQLDNVPVRLVNCDFEEGLDTDGSPTGWKLFSKPNPETQKVELVEGRSGKGVFMQDKDEKLSLGLFQMLPAEPGAKYRFSVYKKGSPMSLYIKSFDASRKQLKYRSVAAKNKNANAFEEFEAVDTAAPDAAYVQVIIYFASTARGTVTVDDAKLEKLP